MTNISYKSRLGSMSSLVYNDESSFGLSDLSFRTNVGLDKIHMFLLDRICAYMKTICRSEQVAFENIFALLIERRRILKNQSKNDWHPRLKSLTRKLSIDDCDQKKSAKGRYSP